MDEILKNVDAAFRLISTIPVTQDSVDVMAMARHHLRNAASGLEILKNNAQTKNEEIEAIEE